MSTAPKQALVGVQEARLRKHSFNGRQESAAGLILQQPPTLVGLSRAQRNSLVISAADDGHGNVEVICRFGDDAWNLSSVWTLKTARGWERIIHWPPELPQELTDDLKAVLYIWMHRGMPNVGPVVARSAKTQIVNALPLLKHLVSLGVRRMEDVEPIQVANFVSSFKGKFVASYLAGTVELLTAAWVFREELLYPLRRYPLSAESISQLAGQDPRLADKKAMLTPVIPPSVTEQLFERALAVIAEAPRLLESRDSGTLMPTARKLLPFRDASLFLLQISTGMRNSEALGIKANCWRVEEKNGIVYHWIRTVDIKTKAGPVEYLMPPEMVSVLELLMRFAEPLQALLRKEVQALNRGLGNGSKLKGEEQWVSGAGRPAAIQRRDDAQSASELLFLGQAGRKRNVLGDCVIEAMNNGMSREALVRLSRSAGVNWPLNNMQCRRTFAWMAAHSALGVHGSIFIRWQFHHSNLSLSHLYGANPLQAPDLYGELFAEFGEVQAEVMSSWFLSDEPLSGGGGKRVMRARATPMKDLQALVRATTGSVTIRSTGHSWCMAPDGKCIGGGVYDSPRCVNCSEGVIDASFAGTWQRIHSVNLKLQRFAGCGPGAAAHVERSLKASRQVLLDLGVPEPTCESF